MEGNLTSFWTVPRFPLPKLPFTQILYLNTDWYHSHIRPTAWWGSISHYESIPFFSKETVVLSYSSLWALSPWQGGHLQALHNSQILSGALLVDGITLGGLWQSSSSYRWIAHVCCVLAVLPLHIWENAAQFWWFISVICLVWYFLRIEVGSL